MSLEELRGIRVQKLEKLQEYFGAVYPIAAGTTELLKNILADFAKFKKRKKALAIAGRVRGIRGHGGSTFLDFEDGDARLQCYLKKDEIGSALYNLFIETIDVGDIIGVSGSLFVTKKKEKTILVSRWWPLAKSLRPLPEKWKGLQDVEERFRKRSLDLLMNQEARDRFTKRTEILHTLRDFFNGENFKEMETPILQPLYGGALARPFITHHHALDTDFYLRIAPELYLKRLLVGNFPRVYEIGKCFRNEGIDVTHSPEFTMLEGYMAYGDFVALKDLIEKMIMKVAKTAAGKNKITYDGKLITLKKPFRSMTFFDAISRYALLPNIKDMDEKELHLTAKQLGIELKKNETKGKIFDEIFKKAVRRHLIEPTFITHHPLDISPLAKASEDYPGSAERLQLVVGGLEVVNAYVELNDPIEQKNRFLEQEKLFVGGNEEVSRFDQDYIETLEYGMPPTIGFGIGVDRIVQLFTDSHNIREVILFPALKPKE